MQINAEFAATLKKINLAYDDERDERTMTLVLEVLVHPDRAAELFGEEVAKLATLYRSDGALAYENLVPRVSGEAHMVEVCGVVDRTVPHVAKLKADKLGIGAVVVLELPMMLHSGLVAQLAERFGSDVEVRLSARQGRLPLEGHA